MQNNNLVQYKQLYLETARQYLGKIETDLKRLKIDDPGQVLVNELYMSAHSLGSQNFAMGYNSTAKLCKVIESFLASKRLEKNPIPIEKINTMLESVKWIRDSVDNIDMSNQELDLSLKNKELETTLGIGA